MPVNLNLYQIKKYIKTQIYKKVDIFFGDFREVCACMKIALKIETHFCDKMQAGSAYTQLQLLHFSNCDAFRAGKSQNGQVQQTGLRPTKTVRRCCCLTAS